MITMTGGMRSASSQRLSIGGVVIALDPIDLSLSTSRWKVIMRSMLKWGLTFVLEAGMFWWTSSAHTNDEPLLSLSSRVLPIFISSTSHRRGWWTGMRVGWQADRNTVRSFWQYALHRFCKSAILLPSVSTFVFRSREVGQLLLDLDLYLGTDHLAMFSFFMTADILAPCRRVLFRHFLLG